MNDRADRSLPTPRRRSPPSAGARCAFAVLGVAAWFAPFAGAAESEGPRRILLDNDLRAREVEVIAIDTGAISFIDADGSVRTLPAQAVVAMLPPDHSAATPWAPGRAPPAPGINQWSHTGLLILTDAARYPGQRAGAGDDPERLLWRHPRFGRLSFLIDSLSAVVLDAGSPVAAEFAASVHRATNDVAWLVNADRVSGLLTAAGEPFIIETDAGPVSLASSRVVAISLSNPPSRASGPFVWLDDGTATPIVAIAPERRQSADQPAPTVLVTLQGDQQATFALGAVRAITHRAERITALAALTPSSQSPLGERAAFQPLAIAAHAGLEPRAPLGADPIELPGPMRAVWSLPPNAVRFGARAVLPSDARPWGDCEIVVSIDDAEVFRARLNSDSPVAAFAVSAQGRELTISVEPGEFGPINDRVILERAIILSDTPTS